MFVCTSVFLFVPLSVCLFSVCLSVCLFVYFVWMSVCCLSVCLFVYLFVWLSVCLFDVLCIRLVFKIYYRVILQRLSPFFTTNQLKQRGVNRILMIFQRVTHKTTSFNTEADFGQLITFHNNHQIFIRNYNAVISRRVCHSGYHLECAPKNFFSNIS